MSMLSSSQRRSLTDRVLRYSSQLLTPEGAAHHGYLTEDRQLSPATIARFQLGAVVSPDVLDEEALDMVAIPYITPNGPVALRFRRPPWKEDGPKYWQPKGSDLSIFNTPDLLVSEDRIAVTEGEVDCMTLVQAGIPAVGIPGASAWKDHYELLFEGYSEVLLLGDNDDSGAGRQFVAKLSRVVPGPRVVLMPEGHDVNSYYCEHGRQALRDLLEVDK